MEIRTLAERVLLSPEIERKCMPADSPLTDDDPGEAVRLLEPARPPELRFSGRRHGPAMPRRSALRDPRRRAVAHHIMANHELQALEVMAWTLCAFPEAPAEFRRGMAEILHDEQRHTRMHVERAARLGLRFGELPVNGYIWQKAMEFRSPLDYLACIPLLFEARNLDHTLEFAEEFEAAGDPRSAALMRTIHQDEIRHVAFGMEWLNRLKARDQSDWEAFESHLHWPLRPAKARGRVFRAEARRLAGMSDAFIDRIRQTGDE